MKKLVILQSNYVPWKGYFDLMINTDEFMILDDVQYTKNDWRNRNQIKTAQGKKWLTLPVSYKFSSKPLISSIEVCNNTWATDHLEILRSAYKDAPYFNHFFPTLKQWMQEAEKLKKLSQINIYMLSEITQYLRIDVKLTNSQNYISANDLQDLDKNERLVNLCSRANATDYITGPSALDYLDISRFTSKGINVHLADYSEYPEYSQLHGTFDHHVTILDLIFNVGPDSLQYMKQKDFLQKVPSTINAKTKGLY